MMQTITTGIKRQGKDAGIVGLLEGYTPQEPEEAGKVEVSEGGYDYRPLLAKLEEYLDAEGGTGYNRTYIILSSIDSILTPEQINQFLQTTTKLEKHPRYVEETTSFISVLIEKSYRAGHDNFTLDLNNLRAHNRFGCYIQGKEKDPVIIHITGETGNYFGYMADNCIFNIEKTGKECGSHATNCTFKTTNQETLQKMLTEVPRGNRVVFIDADGKEEVKRDYND